MTIRRLLLAALLIVGSLATLGAHTLPTTPLEWLNPRPQKVITTSAGQPLLLSHELKWQLVASDAAAEMFHSVVECPDVKWTSRRGFKVRVGLTGDKAVATAQAPARAEGYLLTMSTDGITVVGHDTDGLYYGLQTLAALLRRGRTDQGVMFECCQIEDWPEIAERGVVEGFYGTPWSHSARLDQMDFYGRNKLNTYIYGPKDDPWHRGRWREPYPADQAARLGELVEAARRNHVTFYWAIHPGGDIKWTTADRDALVAKFEQVYELGVRAFAVFFDDIGGEGARADKQAELLNFLHHNFVATHPDVEPLMLCPTEYNRAWANDAGGYLRTLGSELDSNIRIMWTGNRVISTIDREAMGWINERIGRKGFVWFNFPVNDYVRDHLLLGPVYGNAADVATDVAGFVSNPMEYAQASKIALYSIADYTWNTDTYDADHSWLRSLATLLPTNSEALRIFALYNKDMGENVHQFRREEGSEIEQIAALAIEGDSQALEALAQVCRALGEACDALLADTHNPQLIEELRPWLVQGQNVAAYGGAVVEWRKAGCQGDDLRSEVERLRRVIDHHDTTPELRHPYQTGTKVGSKVLMPTLDKLAGALRIEN